MTRRGLWLALAGALILMGCASRGLHTQQPILPPKTQMVNSADYRCRLLYWHGETLTRTGKWSSGNCAEALMATDLYMSSGLAAEEPQIAVTVEMSVAERAQP